VGEITTDATLPAEIRMDIVHLAEHVVVEIAEHARLVRFWENQLAQEELRRRLIVTLDDGDLVPFGEQDVVADHLMDLARANRRLIAERAGTGGRR